MRHVQLMTFVAAMSIATSALADVNSDADALFRDGRKAASDGHFELACAKFEASQKLQPASGTLLNLADCEEARGQLSRAWRDFLALADSLAATDDRKAVALERATRLERSMPKLRIRLAASSLNARVWRDDTALGDVSMGVALPVDPGPHVILVRESDHTDRRYELSVARGDEKDFEVEHGAKVVAPPKTLAFVLGGIGVASLAVGATTAGFALSNLSASNSDCVGSVCRNQIGVDHYRSAQSFALATDIALSVGVGFLATGLIMLLVPRWRATF